MKMCTPLEHCLHTCSFVFGTYLITDLLLSFNFLQIHNNVNLQPGFQIIFDNLNLKEKVRHKTAKNKNKQHNLVQSYAVLDRINLEGLPNESPISDAKDLPTDSWWLPKKEQQAMKTEMTVSL